MLSPITFVFEYAIEILEVERETLVFVDDQPKNVAGAESAGIFAVWFDVTDPAGSVRRILDHL